MSGPVAKVFFLLALSASMRAQTGGSARDIQIPKISTPPLLTEFLEGKSRPDMRLIDGFRQRKPGDGDPISRKTQAWIGYDDRNFYAIFVCDSPPGHTRASLSKREDLFNDDIVGIFLDTWQDHQRAYEFFVNPLGVQADAVTSERTGDDTSFDTVWRSEGRITSSGFVTLMAIPFRSLRFPGKDIQTWGFGLGRFMPEINEDAFWPFITNKVSGFAQQLGNMRGLEKISPGRNLQFTPYGALGRSHFLDNSVAGTPLFRSQTDPRAGFDAKAVIHDSLTLDVAVNPDFSQVESDDPQVTVNQRFEVQFSEKRPFFLENNGFFATPENLFFSRRIIDPEFGTRLTGKIGRWSLGVLAVDDRAPGRAEGTGEHAVIGVARIQREFGVQSSAGILITDREFHGTFNRVAAFDTRLKLNKNWTWEGQAIASQTRTESGVVSGGDAFTSGLNFNNREWSFGLGYSDRSEGFRTDLGFVPRVNIRSLDQFIGRRFYPKDRALVSWRPAFSASADFDHRNVQQDWSVQPGLNLEFRGATFLGSHIRKSFERFADINFTRNDYGFGGHTEYFKRAIFDFGYSKGSRINYDPPVGRPAFLGNGSDFNLSITLKPTSRLKLDEIYVLTRLYTIDPHPTAIFLNHLARSRLNYQFSRELSLRLILDYNATLQNSSYINLERQKRIAGDVLLTYLIHPGTAFYIGYTDRLENVDLQQRRLTFPSVTTSRQFFTKLTYQFRF